VPRIYSFFLWLFLSFSVVCNSDLSDATYKEWPLLACLSLILLCCICQWSFLCHFVDLFFCLIAGLIETFTGPKKNEIANTFVAAGFRSNHGAWFGMRLRVRMWFWRIEKALRVPIHTDNGAQCFDFETGFNLVISLSSDRINMFFYDCRWCREAMKFISTW
jgi:hypothetical protein